MTNAQKLTLELIRYKISGTPVSQGLLDSIDEELLYLVYQISLEQEVSYLVADALSDLGYVSADGSSPFFAELLSATYRTDLIKYELKSISELFEREEIAFIPLKGSVIRDLYPKPEMRSSCDIDILILKDDLPRAQLALESELNYEKRGKTPHDIALFSPSEIELELHFRLIELEKEKMELLDMVWDNATIKDGTKYEYLMSGEYLLLYHMVHMSKHIKNGGCGIRPFLDLMLLCEKTTFCEQKLFEMLDKTSLKDLYENALNTAFAWFGSREPDRVCELFADFVFSAGIYGNFENMVAVSQSKNGTKLKTLMERVFISYEKLKLSYPIIEEHPILTPYYEVVRWFRIIFKDKAKNQLVIMKHNVTMDEEKRKSVDELMSIIKL